MNGDSIKTQLVLRTIISCFRTDFNDSIVKTNKVFVSFSKLIDIILFMLEDAKIADKVFKSLKNSGLINAVGIATSLTNSGEQW